MLLDLMMNQCVLVSAAFPLHSPAEMTRLIHTPELWGTGPLLLLGVPRFHFVPIHRPVCNEHNTSVTCSVGGVPASITFHPQLVDVSIDNRVSLRLRVHPYDKDNRGSLLTMSMRSSESYPIDHEYTRKTLERFMWSALDSPYARNPTFEAVRKKLRIEPPSKEKYANRPMRTHE